jgi:hypothetical protein
VVFWVVEQFVEHWTGGSLSGLDVGLMLRSEQKIVNSPTAIVFDNRTQN